MENLNEQWLQLLTESQQPRQTLTTVINNCYHPPCICVEVNLRLLNEVKVCAAVCVTASEDLVIRMCEQVCVCNIASNSGWRPLQIPKWLIVAEEFTQLLYSIDTR